MITEFVFVRHGETDANLSGTLQGNSDIPLNCSGEAQSRAVAEYLRDAAFDAAFCSD